MKNRNFHDSLTSLTGLRRDIQHPLRLTPASGSLCKWLQRIWRDCMNRCIIIGAMSHDNGGEMKKLLTSMTGIQKNPC